MNQLIVVDKDDKILTYKSWQECHGLKPVLHRAFSIFIFNKNGKLLIQQRSEYKPLWPLFWSNSCCSHPRRGEEIIPTAEKRLKEEVGFTTKLRFVYKFIYKADYKSLGAEHEVCHVLQGEYNGQVKADEKEVADYKWVTISWLKKDFKDNSAKYTPWFKKIIKANRLRG